MIARHISRIYHLKGLDCATHIRVRPGIDRISHPDIGYHHFWTAGFRTAGSSHGLRRDRNHGSDIQLGRSLQSSCLHIQVNRFVRRMPEADHDRRPGQHSFLQDELEISRSFRSGRGTGHAIGCCDHNICYRHLLLRVGIALDHSSFNRHRLPHLDRPQPVRAQEQTKNHGCRHCDDRPDNFFCRHSAPIEQFSRGYPGRLQILWPFSLKENGTPQDFPLHRYGRITLDSWTRDLEHMLPGNRSYRRIRASIIQYMCRRESISWKNVDGLNEHG